MAETLTRRGLQVTLLAALPQLMSTVDAELAGEVEDSLVRHGVQVHTDTAVTQVAKDRHGLVVHAGTDSWPAGIVLVVTEVRPDTGLAAAAGLQLGTRGAIVVDRDMRTSVADVYAAGDCTHTYHRLLDKHVYLPLGSTAHKQGRVAGINATGRDTPFAGSLSTQVIRVFDRVVAATGLRADAARQAGFAPLVVEHTADDHKAYYPGPTPLRMRLVGHRATGRLLGAQLVGHHGAEIAKRVDVIATAISYGATVDDLPQLDLATHLRWAAPTTRCSTPPTPGPPHANTVRHPRTRHNHRRSALLWRKFTKSGVRGLTQTNFPFPPVAIGDLFLL